MLGSTQHLQTHSFRKPLGASTTGQKPELDFWYAELCFLHKPECHRLQRGRARMHAGWLTRACAGTNKRAR